MTSKMLISNRCIRGLMPNLIKKSWTVSTQACSRENAGAHNQVPRIFQGINSYSTTYLVYHICTQRVKIWPVCKLEAFYERAAGTSASGNPPSQDIWGFKNDDIKPKLFPVFKGFTLCEIVGFRVNGIFFVCTQYLDYVISIFVSHYQLFSVIFLRNGADQALSLEIS